MNKRLLSLFLALALLILPLFSCKNNGTDTSDAGTQNSDSQELPAPTEPTTESTESNDPDFSVPAEASVYSGTPDTSWYTGDKTEYVLTTADQFVGLNLLRAEAKGAISFEGVTVKLGTDVIINSGSMEEVIARGDNNHSLSALDAADLFKGTFDGQGYRISGIYMKATTDGVCGIFGNLGGNAVIQNLTLANCYVAGASDASKEILGCIASTVSGEGASVKIANVDAQFTVAENGQKISRVGGFVGSISEAVSLTMENCRFYGDLTVSGNEAGGLIGSANNKSASLVLNACENHAKISAASYAGGLIGKGLTLTLSVTDCSNGGEITANYYGGNLYGAASALNDPTGGARPASPEGFSSLRVMSFNIQDSLSKSGSTLTQASLNRLAALSKEILSYEPDLIGMQEDNATMHENLKLDGYIKAPNSFTTGEFCAIYYKDTMTLLASGGTWLTHTGNISSAALNYNDLTDPSSPYYMTPEELKVLEITKTADLVAKKTTYYDKTTQKRVTCSSYTVLTKRKASWAVFEVDGQPVIYFNTHLTNRSQNAVYSNDELQKIRSFERLKEYEYIQAQLAELRKTYPDAPVFMTGDWNHSEYTPIYNAVCESGFSSAALISETRYGPLGSWNYAFDNSVQGDSYPANANKENTAESYVDFCFVTSEINVLKFISGQGKAEITLSDGTKKIIYTSDHLPVITDLCFPKK